MRALFAWEIGNNASHLARLAEVARAMHRKKAVLFFAVQQPAALRPHLDGMRYELFQAPHVKSRTRGAPLIYPDMLRGWGYEDAKILAGQIVAWRSLYMAIKPDVLIVQNAPTALLAARPFKFRKVAIGTGFDIPQLSQPMPLLTYWEKIDDTVLERREGAVLHTINEALEDLNLAKLKSFAEMMKVHKEYLTVFEELDHYPGRNAGTVTKANYTGPFYNMEAGKSVSWNKGEGRRILACLRPDLKAAGICLQALRSAPKTYDIIVSAPGLAEKNIRKLEKPNVRIFNEPVRLDKLLKKCDAAIGHATTALSSAFLMGGVPQLMLPVDIEQLMFARAIGRQKAGLGLAGAFKTEDTIVTLRKLCEKPDYKKGAAALAAKYKEFDPAALAGTIAGDIDRLAS